MVEPETDASRFWRFALATYMPPERRALFLRLQDEGGADVPMALFCLWRGAQGRRVPEASMTRAVAFSAAWRAARVEPLRALRTGWKGGAGAGGDDLPPALSEAARQCVAKAEQAVERLQMEHLATLPAGGEGDARGAAGDNLALYCRLAGLSPDPALLDAVSRMTWMDPPGIS